MIELQASHGRTGFGLLLILAIGTFVSTPALAQFELGERALQLGSWGADVFHLQQALNRMGYAIKSDGHFGKETERAVIAFQIANGLEPDGIAGEKTIRAVTSYRPLMVYRVAEGDTLRELAEAFGTSVEDLSQLNQLRGGEPPAGTELLIPVRPTYRVRTGDTLSRIAARFATTVRTLVELNQIDDPDFIRAGMTLRLPQGSEPATPGF